MTEVANKDEQGIQNLFSITLTLFSEAIFQRLAKTICQFQLQNKITLDGE
jgi:hypothetical protein